MGGSTEKHNKKNKKKKQQSFLVEVAADSDGRAAAPIVAYFPSGYNPEEPGTEASAYHHISHSSRIELVVNPTASSEFAGTKSNVQFVGSSYQGEAAAGPQLCSYTLGVLDKEKQTLRLVPITANKILRMVPRVIDRQPGGAETDEAAEEEVRKIAELTSLYGTKRDKKRDIKLRILNEQMRHDPLAGDRMESSINDAEFEEAHNDISEAGPRNIPPHNVSADRPDNAYPLDEIILKHERGQLLDVLELMNSGESFILKTKFWQDNGYPSFVYNRVHKLRQMKSEEEKASLACIMSYISHLIKFMELHKRRNFHGSSADQHSIPRVVYQKLMTLFVDPITQAISSEKKELLIEYILVLTLHVDRFHTDPSDIARDLKMPDKSLALYYYQLGCKLKQGVMTLPLPLDFPKLRRRSRKRR